MDSHTKPLMEEPTDRPTLFIIDIIIDTVICTITDIFIDIITDVINDFKNFFSFASTVVKF